MILVVPIKKQGIMILDITNNFGVKRDSSVNYSERRGVQQDCPFLLKIL